MAAMKEAASFAQRVAIPRQRLRAQKMFSNKESPQQAAGIRTLEETNDVPCPIQFMIVCFLLFSAFNRRDNCCYISFLKHVEQFVRVIRFVRKERFRLQTIYKERRLAAVHDSAAYRYPVLVNCQM
jgi:hypothetical protein